MGRSGRSPAKATTRRPQAFRSKHEQVYDYLREAILLGELVPGHRLVIDDLADELGISQIPIREALRQLEADGLVTIAPYVGAAVADLHAASIGEVFALLEAMEVITGRAACQRLADDQLAALEALLREMDGLVDEPEAWSERNKDLHRFIAERADTPLTRKLFDKVLDHWDRLRRYYLADVSALRIQTAQQEHWQLFQALLARDPDRVETIVRAHNKAALDAYLAHLAASGALPIQDHTT